MKRIKTRKLFFDLVKMKFIRMVSVQTRGQVGICKKKIIRMKIIAGIKDRVL
jgi:hypothetical protein